MNIAKKLLLLVAVIIARPLSGANMYIHFDPQCMNRMEYSSGDETANYVVYQIKVNDSESVILEVGLETQRYQNYLPSNALNCTNTAFSLQMVNNINQQRDQAFIVYQKGRNQYFVSPVSFAAYYVHTSDKISYNSPQYQFELNLKQGIIGENIAMNRQRAEVYFDGRLENQCSGAYIFRQFSLYTSNPHLDIIIVPEIGLVEERSGRTAEDALQNIKRLEKVNDQYLSDYMDMVCRGIMPENIDRGTVSTVYAPGETAQSLPGPSDLQARSPGAIISRKHTVKKGETLFSIAKNNKVTLADLRKWNKLGKSNLIRPGDQLWLGPPVDESKLSQLQPKGEDRVPAPYDIPGTERFAWGQQAGEEILTDGGLAYWEEYPSEYIAQPGETLASIARKFGYTETRFRSMNNLDPTAEVKIGQKLITSDCDQTGRRPAGYDAIGGAADSETTAVPPYESKIIPTTDYYYNQRLNEQRARAGLTTRTTTTTAPVSSFEPYGSNTPKFYETPEATRIQTAPRTAFSMTSPIQAEERPTSYSDVPASYDYDMSTLPQSYDQIGQKGVSNAGTRANRTLHFVKEGETLYDIARIYGTTAERLRELNQLSPGETIMPFQQIFVN